MSVALLVGALNTETKAQKRRRLKFKYDELLFLFSLGLSWSCCGSVSAGILVVCVLCAPLCMCVGVCALQTLQAPCKPWELIPSQLPALNLACHQHF